jgi:subtilisin family serine protease
VTNLVVVLTLIIFAALAPTAARAAPVDDSPAGRAPLFQGASPKIEAALAAQLEQGGTARALVILAEQADVSAARNLPTKEAKGAFVFNTLREVAARTQPPVRAELDRLGLRYRAYYIVNMFAVEGLNAERAATLAARAEVGRIVADPDVPFRGPVERVPAPEKTAAVEWGIQRINADDLWAIGVRGKGIVVANADTGIQWTHPALQKAYRGYERKTGTTKHAYNWWDAIHSDITGGGNPQCGLDVKKPCDDQGHGTHTMGTMVGKASGNRIGVAFKARWIGCRNMEQGVGRPSTYIECFEFFLAPWNKDGNNPDPSRAPDVASNSWGCPASELCTPDAIKTATENLRAAGIFVAASAGNSGPACSTVSDPIGIYDASTTVGATDINDLLAAFSSRGPVLADGSNQLKPDISAPGVNVRSSVPNNAYANFSGTSMAAPHVAGAVALLWSGKPALRGDVDATESALFGAAHQNVSVNSGLASCGGTNAATIPNNLFGYGRLNVLRAYNSVP